MATAITIDTEENGQEDWMEVAGKIHGRQIKDELGYFREEILPNINISEEEKEEVIELLVSPYISKEKKEEVIEALLKVFYL